MDSQGAIQLAIRKVTQAQENDPDKSKEDLLNKD